jgi:hypothetical protein
MTLRDQQRVGDDLTQAFRPLYNPNTSTIRFGEALAQAFVDLRSNVLPDPRLLELFIQVDDALSALLTELWKRQEVAP